MNVFLTTKVSFWTQKLGWRGHPKNIVGFNWIGGLA